MENKTNKNIGKLVLKCIAVVAIIVGVVAIALILFFHHHENTLDAQADFTSFTMTGLDQNSTMTEADLKDYPLTVMNLWQTTCPSCIEEMPDLEELSKEYKGRVQFVGICTNTVEDGQCKEDILSEAVEIVTTEKLSYPQMMPADSMAEFISQIFAYPHTVIVDRNGNVVGTIAGTEHTDKWKAKLDTLLQEVE